MQLKKRTLAEKEPREYSCKNHMVAASVLEEMSEYIVSPVTAFAGFVDNAIACKATEL